MTTDAFTTFIESLIGRHGTRVVPIYFDLADRISVKEGFRQIMVDKPPIDILVNNAGVIHTAPFVMTTIETMQTSFDINLFAPLVLSQLVARVMARQKRGSIINIASSAAIEGNEGRVAYASAKAALIAATKVMSRELGAANIRVNAVAPGLTQTDMMVSSTKQDALDATLARTAMRRVGQPEEIAGAILYLASDLSSYVTGQTLRVDGGM